MAHCLARSRVPHRRLISVQIFLTRARPNDTTHRSIADDDDDSRSRRPRAIFEPTPPMLFFVTQYAYKDRHNFGRPFPVSGPEWHNENAPNSIDLDSRIHKLFLDLDIKSKEISKSISFWNRTFFSLFNAVACATPPIYLGEFSWHNAPQHPCRRRRTLSLGPRHQCFLYDATLVWRSTRF